MVMLHSWDMFWKLTWSPPATLPTWFWTAVWTQLPLVVTEMLVVLFVGPVVGCGVPDVGGGVPVVPVPRQSSSVMFVMSPGWFCSCMSKDASSGGIQCTFSGFPGGTWQMPNSSSWAPAEDDKTTMANANAMASAARIAIRLLLLITALTYHPPC